jgi:hypothetical protein
VRAHRFTSEGESAGTTAPALLALFLTSSYAQAQATRTWVSGGGDDANLSSRARS